MNPAAASGDPTAAAPVFGHGPATVRRNRATVARRLHAAAPEAVAVLDWPALESAPAWLALAEPDLARFTLQAGALRHAPLLRMWIDAQRLAAARAAVGTEFFQSLLALPEARLPLSPDLMQGPPIAAAEQVVPALRAAGQAVLLASLPTGCLRDAIAAAWSAVAPAALPEEVARTLVARVASLASEAHQ